MSDSLVELRRKAFALATEDRVLLAEDLLASVQPFDPQVEAAWNEEIKRRVAEVESGAVKTIPAEEVFAKLRRLLSANPFAGRAYTRFVSTVDIAKLSPQERLQLLEQIWDSLCDMPEAVPMTDAQREELDRRLDELDREGPAGIPWNEVLDRIRNRKA